MKYIILNMALIGSFLISANSFSQEQHHDHGNGEATKPIAEIMQGMDENLHKLTSAITVEDYPAITSSAHDIANHPGIAQEDLHVLFERLGSQKDAFIACDTAVHNLAKSISEAGKEENMDLALQRYSAMLSKTVECHKAYR